ncbi:MAG: Rpn family recombination-promoting nuclease/putative transposase, partial [Muribaculaceae bacterium]|nr:Rpn family recombination-promoting nuclease/putative transposase [Muribaculaceae bacterium]
MCTSDDRLIRFDWAMKRMLRDKANFGVLEGLLTSLLGRPIHIETILESESNREAEEQKLNRVDILAQTTDREKMLIEVQNQSEIDYFHRMLFGT